MLALDMLAEVPVASIHTCLLFSTSALAAINQSLFKVVSSSPVATSELPGEQT